MAVLSLVFLIGSIVLGYLRKTNIGLMAVGLALILGIISGTPVSTIQAGFPTKLFVTLLGVMLMFSIAQENKTMELLARRVVALAGKRTNLIPIIVYVFSVVLAAVGPGTIPVMSIMAVFTCSLAAEMKISPLLLAPTSVLGAAAGGLTSIAPTGILGINLAEQSGVELAPVPYLINMLIAMTVYFIILYIILGGYKMKSNVDLSQLELPKFNGNQIITLIGILVMVVLVVGFGLDVGMVCFSVSMVYLVLRVADEKKSIQGIPWSTLVMVAGVNMLMSMALNLGGIDLLSAGLSTMMTPSTAPGVLGLTAGIMSWFSSTSGVVMPTLIPSIPGIIERVGSVSYLSMISAVTNTASAAGMSPLSTGGSLGLSAYSQVAKPTEAEAAKLFIQLFLISAGGVVVVALVSMTGVYNIFG